MPRYIDLIAIVFSAHKIHLDTCHREWQKKLMLKSRIPLVTLRWWIGFQNCRLGVSESRKFRSAWTYICNPADIHQFFQCTGSPLLSLALGEQQRCSCRVRWSYPWRLRIRIGVNVDRRRGRSNETFAILFQNKKNPSKGRNKRLINDTILDEKVFMSAAWA